MTQVAKDTGLKPESLYRALSADGKSKLRHVLKVNQRLWAGGFMPMRLLDEG